MKYKLGQKPRRKYHIISVINITLAILLGLIVIDCLFNYGKLTIEILWQISEGV